LHFFKILTIRHIILLWLLFP